VPFALLAFALLFLIGFTAVSYDVGRLAVSRFGIEQHNPYFVAATGIAVVLSPVPLTVKTLIACGALGPARATSVLASAPSSSAHHAMPDEMLTRRLSFMSLLLTTIVGAT